jgi:pimeloyl-ACP methyl ester carboxylesterase
MVERYATAPNRTIAGDDGTTFTYRDVGSGEVPLVLLQHFRGNLDHWDPALIDALASERRVVAFDNCGVGASSGTTPNTVEEMARGALSYLEAMELDKVDVLGFSIGSFVAQEMALIRPDLARRVVLAASAPKGAAGMHGWAPAVMNAIGKRDTEPEGYLRVFYSPSNASQSAGRESLKRSVARVEDRDRPVSWETRLAQYDAVCTWGIPDYSQLQRLQAITAPVFVASGDSDPMILPRYSHLLAGLLPNASLTTYADAAHGFLFQHHEAVAADVNRFLDATEGAMEG